MILSAYKQKIIKHMIDGGIDEDTAYAFAEKMAKEMKKLLLHNLPLLLLKLQNKVY